MSIDWSTEAPKGATHVYIKKEGSPVHSHWIKAEGNTRYFIAPLEHDGRAWMKDLHTVDLDKCIANPFESWSGEGHPPVGTVCDMTTNDGYNWRPVKIIFFDDYVTLVGEAQGKVDRQIFKRCDADIAFRPIRTPEQIAADEREAAINGMLCYDALGNSRRGLAEALHDAGFRKQEAP